MTKKSRVVRNWTRGVGSFLRVQLYALQSSAIFCILDCVKGTHTNSFSFYFGKCAGVKVPIKIFGWDFLTI